MTCEYCDKEGGEEIIIQRVNYTLCKFCQLNASMKDINDKSHLRAVKDGDIDCKPMCGTCREYAHDLQDLTHEKT